MTSPAQDIARRNPHLVGREALLDDLLARARTADALEVVEVVAGEGMGKTTLLAHACCRLAAEDGITALFATFAHRHASPSDRQAQLSEYHGLLRSLARQLEPALADAFAADVRATFRAYADGLDKPAIVDVAVEELADAFMRRLEDCGRVLIVLDDVHRIERDAVGDWLGRHLPRIPAPNTALLGRVGARPPGTPLPVADRALALGTLGAADVAAYLERVTGAAPSALDAAAVARWTGGHPLALRIAAEHVGRHGYGWLAEPDRHDGELAERIARERVETLDREDLRAALDVSAVLRAFDGKLLSALVGHLVEEPGDDLIERLEEHALVEPLRDHMRADPLADGRRRLRNFLRPPLVRRLAAQRTPRAAFPDRSALTDLHHLAVEHYEDELRGLLDEPAAYGGWEQLERPRTWELVLEYLHHAAHLSPERGRLSAALVYFDAFWWWGAYAPFPLCDAIVGEGTRALEGHDDGGFVRALRAFHDAYPEGPAAGADRWRTVRDELRRIRALTGADGDAVAGRRLRHLRAITDVLLADAHRHVDAADGEADRLLDDAAVHFERAGDDWCVPWVCFHRVELELARARAGTAVADVERHAREAERQAERALTLAADLAIDERDRDHELLANARRGLADVAWLRGDARRSVDALAHALLHAYRFQAAPRPDAYTRALLRELVARTAARLRRIADADAAAAVEACTALHRFWGPYWEALGLSGAAPDFDVLIARAMWDDVTAAVAPAEPASADMAAGSAYAGRAIEVYAAIARRGAPAGHPPAPRADRVAAEADRGPEEGWFRPRSLAALAAPVVDGSRFEPPDHPAWPSAWRALPIDWPDLEAEPARRTEVLELLRSAIADLPPDRRAVLERRDVGGESAEQVARELGFGAADQTVMLHRARAALVRALEPYVEHLRS